MDLLKDAGLGSASPEIHGEFIPAEPEESNEHHEGQDGHDLGNRGDEVHEGGLLDAAGEYRENSPRQKGDGDGGGPVMVGVEKRQVMAQGIEKEGGIAHLCHNGAQPVAPAGGKTNKIAEAGPHVGINARIKVRLSAGQNLKNKRHRQHADARYQPANEHRAWAGNGGNVLRQRENTRANGGTDNERDEGPQRHGVGSILAGGHWPKIP